MGDHGSELYELWSAIDELKSQYEVTNRENEHLIEENARLVEEIEAARDQASSLDEIRQQHVDAMFSMEIEGRVLSKKCEELEAFNHQLADENEQKKAHVLTSHEAIQVAYAELERISGEIRESVSPEAFEDRFQRILDEIKETTQRIRELDETCAMANEEALSIAVATVDAEETLAQADAENAELSADIAALDEQLQATTSEMQKKKEQIRELSAEIHTLKAKYTENAKANLLSKNQLDFEQQDIDIEKRSIVQRSASMEVNLWDIEKRIAAELGLDTMFDDED